jgi:hypothetical protein
MVHSLALSELLEPSQCDWEACIQLFGQHWANEYREQTRNCYAVHNLGADVNRHQLVLKEYAQQWDFGFNCEQSTTDGVGNKHGNRVALGWRKLTSSTFAKRSVQSSLLGIWIPSVPISNVFVDMENFVGLSGYARSVFNLHMIGLSTWRAAT